MQSYRPQSIRPMQHSELQQLHSCSRPGTHCPPAQQPQLPTTPGPGPGVPSKPDVRVLHEALRILGSWWTTGAVGGAGATAGTAGGVIDAAGAGATTGSVAGATAGAAAGACTLRAGISGAGWRI